jgi:para-aminobenzoate synthetase/4-amino-4-deoxychorismate lyase
VEILIEFENKPLYFNGQIDIISCNKLSDIPACFDKMEAALGRGHHLAGFLSYEAGYGFEDKLKTGKTFNFPLVHMGVYEKAKPGSPLLLAPSEVEGLGEGLGVRAAGINISKDKYFKNIERIREYIAAGDVYQITYCVKFNFDFDGDEFSLYKKLKREQPVPYTAYIKDKDFSILSLSPEMFIKKCNTHVKTKPMKGTWPRGNNYLQDILAGRALHKDPKNRAENIMICDLLRNDLGRIGSVVRAPKLFEVAKYLTLCQMTSTVTAKVNKDIPLYTLFKSLHPSGSVTGAPKIRAMEIIREIEPDERRIYTGAIGYITPQKDLFFNVPIRTLLIKDGKGEMGVGGGIVWDSTPQGEYDECILKAKFLL